jgi:hypothetical protein
MMSCFVYIASDERLAEQVELRGHMTDVVPSGTVADSQVSVVSWRGVDIDALAVVRAGARVANYKTRITVSDVNELDGPVPIGELLAVLDEPLRSTVAHRLQTGGRLPLDAASGLREALNRLRPGLADIWRELEGVADRTRSLLWVDDSEPIVAYERDAYGLVLSIAGMERAEILSGWTDNPRVPFLEGLAEFRVTEDNLIAHDAQVFGDWDRLRSSIIGITSFHKGGRELIVVNANRTPIEQTLGVDLLYYTHDYEAYVLVQYKRLRKGSKAWEFRPSGDRNFAPELARMRAIARPGPDKGDPNDHRLGENFCFIKFCKPTTRLAAAASGELSAGMYLPLDYFDKLVASEQITGPRGGVVVSYDTVGRWLSNSSFISLVERAWVGTRGLTTAQVTEVVEHALAAEHSVVLAVGHAPPLRVRR